MKVTHTVLMSSPSAKMIRYQAALHFPSCNRFWPTQVLAIHFSFCHLDTSHTGKLMFLSNDMIF